MYLEYEKVKDPKAIEEIVCLKMKDLKQIPMNDSWTEMLILLAAAGKKIPKTLESEKPFLVQVIEKRMKHCFTFKINDDRLYIFLAVITTRPGPAMLYLWYLQWWCFTHNVKELDLDMFCEIFPWGFPSDDDLHKIWDSQKVSTKERGGSDNLVDYASAGESIQFK